MPVKVTTKTTGGQKLRAHLRAIQSGELQRKYMAAVEDGMNREMGPELRNRTPKVTGDLSESYTFRRSGGFGIELRSGVPYANLVTFKEDNRSKALGQSTVRGLSHEVAKRRLPGIAKRAFRKALRSTT